MEFRLGEWSVDPDMNLVWRGDEERRLEHKVMQVLVHLCEAPLRNVSRDELLTEVWEGASVSPQVVTVAVNGLRRALGDSARRPKYIQTIPGHGYRLLLASTTPDHPGTRPDQATGGPRFRDRLGGWASSHPGATITLSLAILMLLRFLFLPHH